jgi:hypothetical protein
MILALIGAFAFVAIPFVTEANAQERRGRSWTQQRRDDNRSNRRRSTWGKSHKKNAHGYRNYGQYRRTQVGNRRSRWVRRYHTTNGRRISRLVRVYY